MFKRYTGLNKLFLMTFTLVSMSSAASAQNNRQYPLDVELLSSTATPLTTNLRQKEIVQHMIINVGRTDVSLDPQPEMICPTAKSPTIQEWTTQPLPKFVERRVVTHKVSAAPKAVIKTQTVARQNLESIGHGTPVSIASAYPFSTGSRSYTIAAKANSHHSALR